MATSRFGCSLRTLSQFVIFLSISIVPAFTQSSARPSPVEVITPKPPTPVIIEGNRVLVYELHITNFGPSSLTLTGVQVFVAGGERSSGERAGGDKLADYSGSSLSALLRPVAESSQTGESSPKAPPSNPGQLDIGHRVIAFMYVTVPTNLRISALRHRFLF